MRCHRRIVLVSTLMLFAFCSAAATAQVTIYDNTAPQPYSGVRADPGEEGFLAQQFLTGDFDNVSSVTLSLFREGAPSGPLHVQLWDDDGSGVPGSLVDSFGSIDVAALPTTAEYVTLDSQISGLSPNTPYYVVLDTIDATITDTDNDGMADNTFRVGLRGAPGAANDEAMLLVWPDRSTGPDWMLLSDLLGPLPDPLPPGFDPATVTSGDLYLQMQVTSIPEPSGAVLGLVGLVAAGGLFRRMHNARIAS